MIRRLLRSLAFPAWHVAGIVGKLANFLKKLRGDEKQRPPKETCELSVKQKELDILFRNGESFQSVVISCVIAW